jgi:hypothetical protein
MERGQVQYQKDPASKLQIVRAPKSHGGLGILDPTLTNLALGAKILWHLVSDKAY